MSSDSRRLRVRWWDDISGTSYAGVKDQKGWCFYEKEPESVRWFEIQPSSQLVTTAETLFAAGEHVEELPADDGTSRADLLQDNARVLDPLIKVFICYAKEDQDEADRLFRRLRRGGFDPWMDKHRLVLGDNWEREIRSAVIETDFVESWAQTHDEIGFRQQEVRWALD